MNIKWISSVLLVSLVIGLAQQPRVGGQADNKQKDLNVKPTPRTEQKLPDCAYCPGVAPLLIQPIPLDKNGRPDMQALEKLRQERLKTGELALKYKYNMPIKVPDPNVDYKIQIIRPNPGIEYKIQL